MSTALVYVRQSRHRDDERTTSPEVQETACRNLPAVQACEEIEVFTDLDKSGKSAAARPDFQRFLYRLQDSPPDVVAVYDQSRTFRNTAEALDFYALMERMSTVNVQFVHGRFDRSPTGEFSYAALAAAHTMERKMSASKMRDAYRHMAAKGEMVGQVPAGYVRAKDGTVTVDEDAAAIIRRIFAMYATGQYGVRGLARMLNAEGVRLASLPEGWKGDTVAQIIGNIVYVGKTYTHKRRQQKGDLIAGRWPALIDVATWEAVQRQRQVRRTSTGPQPGRTGRAYVFQKLLRCTTCNGRMHAQTIDGVAYYRCDRSEGKHPCRALVREDSLLPWAEALIERLDAYQPPGFDDAVHTLVGVPPPPAALADIDAELERIAWRFDKGYLSQRDYEAKYQHLQERRREVEKALTQQPSLVFDGIRQAWDAGDSQTRREILGELFEELDVREGEIVGYKARDDRATEVTMVMESIADQADDSGWGFQTLNLLSQLPPGPLPTNRSILLARQGFDSTEVVPIDTIRTALPRLRDRSWTSPPPTSSLN